MSLVDDIASINALRAELDALRPLPAETEQRVLQKLRLEWNYHSAKIEGGSLSFGETKALLLFGITAAQKPLRDHIEMRGHNTAIDFLLGFARNAEPLTESTIRELHKVILGNEPFQAEARTADGQTTYRTITPGRYKRETNHVLTLTEDTLYFTTPEDTPAEMHELVAWYRTEREQGTAHPVMLAATLHYKFVRIHPFDDGNGRVARLLMNLVLLQHGLPPAVVRAEPEQKEQYYRVLQAADAGNLEPLVEYIARSVAHSLELMLRAAQGEDIDDDDDVEKRIVLLQKQLESQQAEKKEVEYTPDIKGCVSRDIVVRIFENIAAKLSSFDKLFTQKSIGVSWDNSVQSFVQVHDDSHVTSVRWRLVKTSIRKHDANTYRTLTAEDTTLSQLWKQYQWRESDIRQIDFVYRLYNFKYGNKPNIDAHVHVEVDFEKYRFVIKSDEVAMKMSGSYDNVLVSEEEESNFIRAVRLCMLERIERYGKEVEK